MIARLDILFVLDPLAGDAEPLAHIHVIGIDALEVFGISEKGMTAIAAVKTVFPLNDHAEVLVVQDNHFYCDALDMRSRQLLNIHQE